MMRLMTALVILVLLVGPARAEEPAADPIYDFCVSRAFSAKGYGSGLDQNRCERTFPGLPDPFTFRCVSYLDRGFPTPLDKLACAIYFNTPDLEKVAPRV